MLNEEPSSNGVFATLLSNGWTFGCEFEWADVDRRVVLPSELGTWDKRELDVHNTDGTAYFHSHIGGEVLTTPVSSPEELADQTVELVALLNPKLTYRCFTHIHIAVPGLVDDLDALKSLLRFATRNQRYINENIAPIVDAGPIEDWDSREDWMAARKWQRQQEYWMSKTFEPPRLEEMYEATTFKEFYEATFTPNKTKTSRLWWAGCRPGVNFRSLKKHGTLEFRFFWGSTDPHEVWSMADFAKSYLQSGLIGDDLEGWYPTAKIERGWQFPDPLPFIPWQERRWQETRKKHPGS